MKWITAIEKSAVFLVFIITLCYCMNDATGGKIFETIWAKIGMAVVIISCLGAFAYPIMLKGEQVNE